MENSWSSAGPTTSGRRVWPQPVPPSAESHLIQPHSHLPRGHTYRATPEGWAPEAAPAVSKPPPSPHPGSTSPGALTAGAGPTAPPLPRHSGRTASLRPLLSEATAGEGGTLSSGPSWCLINNSEKRGKRKLTTGLATRIHVAPGGAPLWTPGSTMDVYRPGSRTTWQPGTSAPPAGDRSHSSQGPHAAAEQSLPPLGPALDASHAGQHPGS